MTQAFPQGDVSIRPVQYSDFEAIERLSATETEEADLSYSINPSNSAKLLHAHRPLRLLKMVLHRPQIFGAYRAERDSKPQGVIHVSPFNRTRTTWRVDQVAALANNPELSEAPLQEDRVPGELSESGSTVALVPTLNDIGSLLLRHCFETIWEARTWLLEVNVNHKDLLALYRQNGFQPLAHMTYWEIDPSQIQELAEREPDLPNLLPISNADAHLLYQLDTMSMPPLVRQVFDRHLADFKTSLAGSLLRGLKNWLSHTEVVTGYVFEPQRKAAIGCFQIQLCRDGSTPHQAQLTVNPAYTWLYPELMSQMARITRDLPTQSLRLASSDYQPEREEYLERLGATRIAHTLMMSRSVWHKVRESRLSAFENIPEMLQGLKPARKAVPSRVSSTQIVTNQPSIFLKPNPSKPKPLKTNSVENGKSRLNLPASDLSDPPQDGPSVNQGT